MKGTTVTIPHDSQQNQDLVAIPRKEYNQFLQMKAEIDDALEKIEEGNKELKQRKIKPISSVRELM